MTAREAIAFVEANGLVLESARGPVPNLAEVIAGERVKGSWWGHRNASQIFQCSRAVRDSKDVLVCRLLAGKVTYVHRRLWPALVRLQDELDRKGLNALKEVHTAAGKHATIVADFPDWVPPDVIEKAAKLTLEKARAIWPSKLGAKRHH